MASLDSVINQLMYGLNPLMSKKTKRAALAAAIGGLGKRAAASASASGAVSSAAVRGRAFVAGQKVSGESKEEVAKIGSEGDISRQKLIGASNELVARIRNKGGMDRLVKGGEIAEDAAKDKDFYQTRTLRDFGDVVGKGGVNQYGAQAVEDFLSQQDAENQRDTSIDVARPATKKKRGGFTGDWYNYDDAVNDFWP